MTHRLIALRAAAARYGVAVGGPVATAGAHFLLSFALLRVLRPAEFGAFSFLFILAQFSWGIWSALFCAPLPVVLQREGDRPGGAIEAIFATNLIASVATFMPFLGAAVLLKLPAGAAALFALYAATALVRWFARSYSYATGEPMKALASDVSYCGVLFVAIAAISWGKVTDPRVIYGALAAGSIAGLLPFGLSFLKRQLSHRWREVAAYVAVWRRYSRWSVLGVLTTEVTGNAHAYVVTAIYGPAAFSVVAATSLLSRPVGVVMNGLTESERARMAHAIAQEPPDSALRSVGRFRKILLASWVGNTAAAVIVLIAVPRLIFPDAYGLSEIWLGSLLWLLVAAARALRTAESVFLQAAGEFQPLATASIISAAVSLASVIVLGAVGGILWSIAGIFIGESVYAVSIWSALRRWQRRAGT
jgi:O-antigen/teichoic acid export membrane protein